MFEVVLLVKTKDEEFEVVLERSMTVGRSPDAALYIKDDGLSRINSNIVFDGEKVWVTDEGSTNGTFVNGQEVPKKGFNLKDGDKIKLGNHTTIEIIFETLEEGNGYHEEVKESVEPQKQKSVAVSAKTKTQSQTVSKQQQQAVPSAQAIFTPTFIIVLASILFSVILVIGIIAFIATRGSSGTTVGGIDIAKSLQDPIGNLEIDLESTDLKLEDPFDVPEEEISTDDEQVVSVADWKTTLDKAKEPRGAPVGMGASVNVPEEFRQYSQRGRFLAIQAATALYEGIRIPGDYAELAELVMQKQLVELAPVGQGYVIYAVGGNGARTAHEPFTHFIIQKGLSVPLYRNLQEYQSGIQTTTRSKELTTDFYKSPANFTMASAKLATLDNLAKNFNGKAFNLGNPADRKLFRGKILTFLRPPVLKVLEEIGTQYKARFGRHLPMSSLVRTLEYQTELSKTNSAAAKNAIPPHTTGCAFDISYGYMTKEEQEFFMQLVAGMEKAKRVEALRENNNCFHIFVFPSGQRPPESVINKVLSGKF